MVTEAVIIIGGGPAGMAAAIELSRQDMSPVIYERYALGGLLNNANLVQNYPGFPNGVRGTELVRLFTQHIEQNSIKVLEAEVTSLDYAGGEYLVTINSGVSRARAVIVATGTKPNTIDCADVHYDVHSLKTVSGKK